MYVGSSLQSCRVIYLGSILQSTGENRRDDHESNTKYSIVKAGRAASLDVSESAFASKEILDEIRDQIHLFKGTVVIKVETIDSAEFFTKLLLCFINCMEISFYIYEKEAFPVENSNIFIDFLSKVEAKLSFILSYNPLSGPIMSKQFVYLISEALRIDGQLTSPRLTILKESADEQLETLSEIIKYSTNSTLKCVSLDLIRPISKYFRRIEFTEIEYDVSSVDKLLKPGTILSAINLSFKFIKVYKLINSILSIYNVKEFKNERVLCAFLLLNPTVRIANFEPDSVELKSVQLMFNHQIRSKCPFRIDRLHPDLNLSIIKYFKDTLKNETSYG